MPLPLKFNNKYRIQSARLKSWDYSNNGAYFVTICTKNREYFFGNVVDGKMILSEIGELADTFLNEIPQHFPHALLDESVVMPNHIHGIIVLDKIDDGDDVRCTDVALRCTDVALQRLYDETNVNDGTNSTNKKMSEISPKPGSIPTILRSCKSAVTKHSRKTNPDFAWQPRFHDHIIRNDKSYNRIKNYIKNNPANWIDDEFCDDEK